MADAQYYIRQPGGNVQGPFERARIEGWIEQGKVRPTMEFSIDGETWMAGVETGLFGSVPPPPAAAAPAAAPPPPPKAPSVARRKRGSGAPRSGGSGRGAGRASELVQLRAHKKKVLREAVLPFALGTVACAIVATVCAFMPFSEVDLLGATADVNGIDSNTGRVLIIAACGGAVAALLALTGQNGRLTLLVAAIALLGAVAMMVIRLESPEEAREAGIEMVQMLFGDDVVTVRTKPARWIAIGACALGALLAFMGSMKVAAAEKSFDRMAREN